MASSSKFRMAGAVMSAALVLSLLIVGTASAAGGTAKPVKGTASVVTTGNAGCSIPVTYTWSGLGSPSDQVDVYVALYLREPGHADVLVDFNTGGDIGSGVARGGTFTFTFHPFGAFAAASGSAQLYGTGTLIHKVPHGTAVLAGSPATSAAIALPMSCHPACDYATNQGCLILGDVVLREAQLDFSTNPPTVNYLSTTTFTIGGNILFTPTCPNDPIGYPGCDWSTITITGSGTFSTSTGTTGTWTASYSSPAPYSFSGGLAPSCQLADIRTITPTLTLRFGTGGVALANLEIRTDVTATGPTKNFIELTNSIGGLPTGLFHTADQTQLLINC